MIGWRGYILWGVLVYLCFLLANLPIGWLYDQLAPIEQPLQWTRLHGTPWSGQATQVSIGPITLGPLRWQFLWQTLWSGRLSVALQWDHGSGASGQVIVGVSVSPSMDHPILFLEKGEFHIPLSWLTTQLAFLPPGSTGQIHLTLDALVLDIEQKQFKQLQGIAELTAFQVGAPIHLLLGDFHLQAQQGEEEDVRVTIQDRQAPIQIKANLQWRRNGHYRIRGTLAPQDTHDERIISLLRLVGPPGVKGRVGLDLSGVFSF